MGHPDEPGDKTEPEQSTEASAESTPDAEPVQENAGSAAPEPEPVAEVIELSETDQLKAQVDELRARLREVSKAYKDREAEMEEFRTRQKAMASVQADRKVFTVVSSFFDPVQNLKRSLDNGGDDLDSFKGGVKMVYGQFQTALEKLGLSEVPGEGSEFDPDAHEALAVMPVDDPEKDGKVVVVHTTGYALRGKTIKAAQVVVGKYTEPAEA